MEFVFSFAGETWSLLLEAGPVLLLGFLLAGLAQAFLPSKRLVGWIGGRGWGAVLRASAAGVPLPLCSCGVMPVAAALRKGGAGRGATVSFLISTPETGVDSIAASAAMLDPVMTVFRPLAAFASAVAAGFAENLLGPGEGSGAPVPEEKASGCCGGGGEAPSAKASGCCGGGEAPPPAKASGCCGGEEKASSGCCGGSGGAEAPSGKASVAGQVLRIAFVDLFDDLGLALLIGFGLAGAVAALAPGMGLGAAAGSRGAWGSLGEMLLLIAAGTPIYVCATAATPLAAAMIAGGVSPGGALAFLLAGPATNAASLALVAKLLGKRSAAIYLASVVLCALAMGFALNGLYPLLGLEPRALAGAAGDCAPWLGPWLAGAGAAAVLGLSLAGAWRRHGPQGLRARRGTN
jgi:uncharacterized membrane protein YraQ (UPF0718 family)